jgi:hypothetical protein
LAAFNAVPEPTSGLILLSAVVGAIAISRSGWRLR